MIGQFLRQSSFKKRGGFSRMGCQGQQDRGGSWLTRVGRIMRLKIELQTNMSTSTRQSRANSMFLGLISAKLLLIAKQLPFWACLVARVRKRKRLQCLVKSYQLRFSVKHRVFIILIFMHSLISALLILSGYFS